IENFFKFIFATPAGNEMYVRMAGKSLLTNVDLSPYFLKYDSVQSRWDFFKSTYLPYLTMNSLPSFTPMKYAMSDPTRFPTAPASIIKTGLSFPVDAKYPENGMIISLGIGIRALSATIRKNIPRYPAFDIVWIIKFAKLLIISKATICQRTSFFFCKSMPLPHSASTCSGFIKISLWGMLVCFFHMSIKSNWIVKFKTTFFAFCSCRFFFFLEKPHVPDYLI